MRFLSFDSTVLEIGALRTKVGEDLGNGKLFLRVET